MTIRDAIDAVHRAFGAPGDWGYGTPKGEALFALYRLDPVEWHPIKSAPVDGTEIILGMFRPEHETPIVMNACWIEPEGRDGYWSDWQGLPTPTHWRPINAPESN